MNAVSSSSNCELSQLKKKKKPLLLIYLFSMFFTFYCHTSISFVLFLFIFVRPWPPITSLQLLTRERLFNSSKQTEASKDETGLRRL